MNERLNACMYEWCDGEATTRTKNVATTNRRMKERKKEDALQQTEETPCCFFLLCVSV